jgi:hypothetical protein
VGNLKEVTKSCEDSGYTVQIQPVSIRDGVTISIVEDPDGNLVEFLQIG